MKRAIAALLALAFGCWRDAVGRKTLASLPDRWRLEDRLHADRQESAAHGFVTRLEVKERALTATTQIDAHSICDIATVSTAYRGNIVRTVIGSDGAVDFDQSSSLAVTMTADAADVVTIYNADDKSGCGMGGGWTLGVARRVEGRFCAPWTFPAIGTSLYERAWVAGDELRIGSFPAVWNNISPDKRPSTPRP